ncbi:hypothetical protein MRBLRH13_000257 [Agrobacterium radiobacter]
MRINDDPRGDPTGKQILALLTQIKVMLGFLIGSVVMIGLRLFGWV